MQHSVRNPVVGAIASVVLYASAWALAAGVAHGQQASQTRSDDPSPGGVSLVFPTGDRATGSLLVEVAGPAEVPVGRTYDYRLRVRTSPRTSSSRT